MFGIWFWLALFAIVGLVVAATKAAIWMAARRWPAMPEWHSRRSVRWARSAWYLLRIGYAIMLLLGTYVGILGIVLLGAIYVFDR